MRKLCHYQFLLNFKYLATFFPVKTTSSRPVYPQIAVIVSAFCGKDLPHGWNAKENLPSGPVF
jgi:hypothetical protein